MRGQGSEAVGDRDKPPTFVIPAQAGIQKGLAPNFEKHWSPAFAGMTSFLDCRPVQQPG